jgi:hypothetical protein
MLLGTATQTLDDNSYPRRAAIGFALRFILPWMIQVRKLVAVELVFLGPKIVFAEYGFAVVVGAAIGILSLRVGLLRTHALWQELLGVYLILLSLTYAVLLALAIAMVRRGTAREEIGDELDNTAATFRKYRRQSLWILVPLIVPLAAIAEQRSPIHR